MVVTTLEWSTMPEKPNSEVKRLDNKVKSLLVRAEGLHSLEVELHHRVNSTARTLTLVLHLLRKL